MERAYMTNGDLIRTAMNNEALAELFIHLASDISQEKLSDKITDVNREYVKQSLMKWLDSDCSGVINGIQEKLKEGN
jgi:hypothetical protein